MGTNPFSLELSTRIIFHDTNASIRVLPSSAISQYLLQPTRCLKFQRNRRRLPLLLKTHPLTMLPSHPTPSSQVLARSRKRSSTVPPQHPFSHRIPSSFRLSKANLVPSLVDHQATSSLFPPPCAVALQVSRASKRSIQSSRQNSRRRFWSWRRNTLPNLPRSTKSELPLLTVLLNQRRQRSRPVRRTRRWTMSLLRSRRRHLMSRVFQSSGFPP